MSGEVPLDGTKGTAAPGLHLSLLGHFELRASPAPSAHVLAVSAAGQRLLALLALRHRPVSRAWIADTLWSGSDERHGSWNLRSTLHRLPHPGGQALVAAAHDQLILSPAVRVDLDDLVRAPLAFGTDQERAEPGTASSSRDGADEQTMLRIAALEDDLLPDWHEDWVIVERERHRQLRLHALESLSRRLSHARRFGLAVHAGLAAVQAEPLRESAHRAVIEAHLGQGNQGEALRQYQVLCRHLLDDLGITPSRALQDLVFASGEGAGYSRDRRSA